MVQEENNHCVAVAQSPQPHFNLIEILSLDINRLVHKLSKFLLNDMKDWLNDNKNNYFKLLLPQEVLQATESQSAYFSTGLQRVLWKCSFSYDYIFMSE